MKTLEELRAELTKAAGELDTFMKGIVDDDGNERDMTEDEITQLDALSDGVELLEKQLKARERAERAKGSNAIPATGEDGKVPGTVKTDEKMFTSFGEQLKMIASAGIDGDVTGKATDDRLIYQKAAGANETVPTEGGFLVQQDFSARLMEMSHELGEIVNRCSPINISTNANSIKLPHIDETSRKRGSRWGGVRAYWAAEGDTVDPSNVKFGELELNLNKLMAIGYATEEMLEDAAVLESVMMRAFAEEINFESEDSIINGNGAGKPLGIYNSGGLVEVAKETGQGAATIVAMNILKMWDRMPIRNRRTAVWVTADAGVEVQMHQMTLPGTDVPIYLPPGMNGNTSGNVYGLLMGRPVIPVEYLPGLGTAGDIALLDLQEYLVASKKGIKAAQSMHVRFLFDEMTFRLTYRVDGQPAWKKPVETANSGVTKSPFVILGARA